MTLSSVQRMHTARTIKSLYGEFDCLHQEGKALAGVHFPAGNSERKEQGSNAKRFIHLLSSSTTLGDSKGTDYNSSSFDECRLVIQGKVVPKARTTHNYFHYFSMQILS